MSLLSALTVFPSSALRGKWEGLIWEINDGTLTVSGGNIPDCTASSAAPWMKFADSVTSILVGDGISVIGERAFEDMTSAKSVSFGNAVTVGKMAFSGCSALGEAVLPESVKTVGDAAFAECTSLAKVSIPSGITFIGEEVFEGCPSLGEISSKSERYPSVDGVLTDSKNSSILRYPPAKKGSSYTAPSEITAVSSGAFRDSLKLETADLGEVRSVGDGAFYGCTSLNDIKIPNVTHIGRAAFYGCTAISKISFSSGLTAIGDDAFRNCSSLSVADFAGDAPTAPEGIFYGTGMSFTVTVSADSEGFGNTWLGYPVVRHGLYSGETGGIRWELDTETGVMTLTGEGAIPDFEYPADAPWYKYRKTVSEIALNGITKIGKNSFRHSSVQSLSLPESVTHIGDFAFYGCEFLENVTAENVTHIGKCAFFGDVSLAWAELGSTVSVGDQAFSGCDELCWVFFGITAPEIGKYVFDGTDAAALYPIGGTGYSGGGWDDVYSEEYLAGDASGDGKFNISDVSVVMKSVAKWDITMKKISADTNMDGRVNLTDAANMLKRIAKWNVTIGIPGH